VRHLSICCRRSRVGEMRSHGVCRQQVLPARRRPALRSHSLGHPAPDHLLARLSHSRRAADRY
jgi:hypothetical protein